ncbi:MAG: hypothetical protein AB1798_02815 [Spirochaetota bacterium]
MNIEKLEGYMINIGLTFENIGKNTWVINDIEKGLNKVFIIADDPLVTIRVKVMEVPKDNREAFFREILTLNATDLIHGAYALENNDVIIIDTLEYNTLDFEEFQASLDAIGLALAQHYQLLSKYRNN